MLSPRAGGQISFNSHLFLSFDCLTAAKGGRSMVEEAPHSTTRHHRKDFAGDLKKGKPDLVPPSGFPFSPKNRLSSLL
ncbi:hypothetical protein Bca101_065654 [Brassica carinata]